MIKPVKHEHTVEVKIPPGLDETAGSIKTHFVENKRPYLFGIGGVVIGFAAARVFSRPSINIEVNVP